VEDASRSLATATAREAGSFSAALAVQDSIPRWANDWSSSIFNLRETVETEITGSAGAERPRAAQGNEVLAIAATAPQSTLPLEKFAEKFRL
jgi:hypothetical protein